MKPTVFPTCSHTLQNIDSNDTQHITFKPSVRHEFRAIIQPRDAFWVVFPNS